MLATSEKERAIDQPPRKRKRRMVAAHTCTRCTKRKQKCNKRIPCDPCIAHGCADLCELYIPALQGHRDGDGPGKVPGVNAAEEHGADIGLASILDEGESGDAIDGDSSAPRGIRPASDPPTSVETSQLAVLARLDRLEAIVGVRGEQPNHGQSTGYVSNQAVANRSEAAQAALPEAFHMLLRSCNLQASDFIAIIGQLPDRPTALGLVDHFFSSINQLRYPIDKPWFLQSFEAVYATYATISKSRSRARQTLSDLRNTARGLPLILITLASSAMTRPGINHDNGKRADWTTSLRLYKAARHAELLTAAVEPESLQVLVANLLIFKYLMFIHDRRVVEAWNILGTTVRIAQSIGCHRDGTKLGLDPVQTEMRRRIWSYIYHADRHFSLCLGRPSAIIDSHIDAFEPSNLDFDSARALPVPRPLTETTSATFLILRSRFARLTGKVADHFLRLDRAGTYAEVIQLDDELLNFAQTLPPHFRVENADESLDNVIEGLAISRYMLGTEIMMIRIMLHRPWFLCRLWSDEYSLSRQACLWSAKKDFELRTNFRRRRAQQHSSTFKGTFREFNAAMIAGIAAITAPHDPEAGTMRLIMKTFLDRHPIERYSDKPRASQKEVAIIFTLYRRAIYVHKHFQWPGSTGDDPIEQLLGVSAPDDKQQTHGNGGDTDDNLPFRADYGEERSTAALVESIFSTMVKRKLLPPGPSTVPPTVVGSPEPQNAPRGEPAQYWAPVGMAAGPAVFPISVPDAETMNSASLDGHSPSFDLQAMFDVWLSANASVGVAAGPPLQSNHFESTGDWSQDIPPSFEQASYDGWLGDGEYNMWRGMLGE